MDRYKQEWYGGDTGDWSKELVKDKNGEWVKYEDVKHLIDGHHEVAVKFPDVYECNEVANLNTIQGSEVYCGCEMHECVRVSSLEWNYCPMCGSKI